MRSSFLALLGCICWLCFSTGNGMELRLRFEGSYRSEQCNSVIDINRVGRNRGYSRYRSRYTNEGPLVCTYTADRDDPYDYFYSNPESQDEKEIEAAWINPEGETVNTTVRSGDFYVTSRTQRSSYQTTTTISLHNYNNRRDTGVYCCQVQEIDTGSGMGESRENDTSTCCVGLYNLCTSSLDNGQVTYNDSLTSGRSVEYSCNDGFELIGNDSAICTSYGLSEPRPRCEYECGPLSNPLNGRVDTSRGTTQGNAALYSCNEGYHLVGQSSRSCQYFRPSRYSYSTRESGWSGSAPICVDSAKIQIKFTHGQNCMLWESRKASSIESTLKTVIRQTLMDSNHSSLENNTEAFDIVPSRTPGFFSCRALYTETTYRTTIYGRELVSASVFANIIQEWVSNGPILQLEWYLVNVDKDCPVRISSELEPECMKNSTTTYYY